MDVLMNEDANINTNFQIAIDVNNFIIFIWYYKSFNKLWYLSLACDSNSAGINKELIIYLTSAK